MGQTLVGEYTMLEAGMPEVYADGLARVEPAGPNVRFTLFVVRNPLGLNGQPPVREVVLNVVMPAAAVPPGIALTLAGMATWAARELMPELRALMH